MWRNAAKMWSSCATVTGVALPGPAVPSHSLPSPGGAATCPPSPRVSASSTASFPEPRNASLALAGAGPSVTAKNRCRPSLGVEAADSRNEASNLSAASGSRRRHSIITRAVCCGSATISFSTSTTSRLPLAAPQTIPMPLCRGSSIHHDQQSAPEGVIPTHRFWVGTLSRSGVGVHPAARYPRAASYNSCPVVGVMVTATPQGLRGRRQ